MKTILSGLGIFLIFFGIVVALLTPIPGVPIGAPISIAGAAMLARKSVRGKTWMAKQIDSRPKIARFVPDWLRDLIFGKAADN